MDRSEVLKVIGNPKQVAREMKEFRQRAKVFSTANSTQLIAQYPNQWVAANEKGVVAHAKTLPALMDRLVKVNIPPSRVMVRFIEKRQRRVILTNQSGRDSR